MAIITLNCNLNGGDAVTPNNELFYRIYGDVNNYASPIHTTGTAIADANVTVNADVVVITNVDGATNISFKIAAVDEAGNEGVLSDAYSTGSWDLENAVLSSDSYDFSAQTTDPGGLAYSLDGTILYLASYSSIQIFQYPLSTPYDLSSAGVSTNITITETPHGIDFSEDGVYLFVANASNKTISRYTLGTPWDVTTAVKDAGDLVSANSNFGVQIKSDGTRIFAVSNTNSVLEHFDLSTPYDLSSAGASRGKALPGLTAGATLGFALKSDGTKVYAMNKTDGVVQFSMDPAWDAFGTTNDGITVPIAATDADFRSLYIPKDIGKYMILDGSTSETIYKWDI